MVYEALRKTGKIEMKQLDAEENIQISINRLLTYLDSAQASKADGLKQSSVSEDESIIYGRNAQENGSFR